MVLIISLLYVAAITLWAGGQRLFGDRFWLVALITPFAPILFLPLPLLALFALLVEALWALLVLLLPLLLFLLLYHNYLYPWSRDQREGEPTDSTQVISLLTFNIWWLSKQKATAIVPYKVSDPAPDLIALQELQPSMSQLLSQELAKTHPHELLDVEGSYEGCGPRPNRLGIYSRYPLTSIDSEHLSARDFRILVARVHHPTQTFLLYNIHPRATNIMRYWSDRKNFTRRVRQSFLDREIYICRMLKDIAGRNEPVVVVGDFNSTELSNVYKRLNLELIDGHRIAGRGFGFTFPTHVDDFRGLPIPRRIMRLDMIWHTKELQTRYSRVCTAHGESDHLPVYAEISLHK